MTDTNNTGKRSWVTPLIATLVVVAALVLGGVGGFALAHATGEGGRPDIQQGPQGQAPGGPEHRPQQGQLPQQGPRPQQGPEGQHGPRHEHGPGPHHDDADADTTDEDSDSSEG